MSDARENGNDIIGASSHTACKNKVVNMLKETPLYRTGVNGSKLAPNYDATGYAELGG